MWVSLGLTGFAILVSLLAPILTASMGGAVLMMPIVLSPLLLTSLGLAIAGTVRSVCKRPGVWSIVAAAVTLLWPALLVPLAMAVYYLSELLA